MEGCLGGTMPSPPVQTTNELYQTARPAMEPRNIQYRCVVSDCIIRSDSNISCSGMKGALQIPVHFTGQIVLQGLPFAKLGGSPVSINWPPFN